jgi:hypothetical protein
MMRDRQMRCCGQLQAPIALTHGVVVYEVAQGMAMSSRRFVGNRRDVRASRNMRWKAARIFGRALRRIGGWWVRRMDA